jgi:hypothetical protein
MWQRPFGLSTARASARAAVSASVNGARGLARAVCHAGCLPRKELHEAWEVARRVRRLFRGGRIVDLGGGHGLLAQTLLILDDSSPGAIVVDKTLPPSAAKLRDVLVQA